MSELLIFGGTTEGRRLAEFCSENRIAADVSVTTDYGASLLPEGISVLTGKLDRSAMTELLQKEKYRAVIDATHPYAEEATRNIKAACENAGIGYYRLTRDRSKLYGEAAENISQIVEMLNDCDSVVLSTLGSSSAKSLTAVENFRERVWLRILPVDGMKGHCVGLGYDESKLICEKGPFTKEQNVCHIRKSGAQILITKESGKTGGYSEKTEAAVSCGIRVITLVRPDEDGLYYEEITEMIKTKLFSV